MNNVQDRYHDNIEIGNIENINDNNSVFNIENIHQNQILDENSVDKIGHVHYSHRSPVLRASLLGATDGLVTVSAILLGVSSTTTETRIILITSISAIVAGSLSMALGEYISVSTQKDCEKADIEKERLEHSKGPRHQQLELEELTEIYVKKGLNRDLAEIVAKELSKGSVNNTVKNHMRDELGIDVDNLSSPWKASLSSGLSFFVGSTIPVFTLFFKNFIIRVIILSIVCVVLFISFGVISAILGGTNKTKPALRILFGGAMAIAITYAIGYVFNIIY